MGIGRRRVGNHTANRLNRIAAICQCVYRAVCLSVWPHTCAPHCASLDDNSFAETRHTVLPTVLGHLLHSFIFNLITDGVGIASL